LEHPQRPHGHGSEVKETPVKTRFAILAGITLISLAHAASLKFDIADKVNWRGEKAQAIPAFVEETYSYDEASDTVTIAAKFDKQGFAPLPPMLALAGKFGFSVEVQPKPVDTGSQSVFGPLVGVEGADAYTLKIRGLGKYVFERPRLGSGKAPESLNGQLEAEVAKIVAAGHLAPWLFLVNVPGSGADDRGDVYWHNPSEALYLLAEVAPLLSSKTQQTLKEYLATERENVPPEFRASMAFGVGTRREYCEPSKALLKKWEEKNFGYLTKAQPGIWSLYGLARFCELAGQKPGKETMDKCNEIVARSMEHRDWATLYWLRGHTPGFNAVHAVNQLFAGLVGYIRLARLAGDKDAEALGWGLFARIAALRFAMGKYTQYMHDARLFNTAYNLHATIKMRRVEPADRIIKVQTDPNRYAIPKDPAWWAKMRNGDWMGDLVTWNWSKPIDNVRQVHRLDETGVDVWEWCGTDCYGTGQKRDVSEEKDYWYMRLAPYLLPFRDMVPELGRFMAGHLKPEAEAFCNCIVENQPHWYITYAEAILSAEIGFNCPCDAYGHFLARAWVLGEKPEQLERYLDVPWLKLGDLYHLHKLAETLKAYRGVTWEGARK
jgi:hypothetical protein